MRARVAELIVYLLGNYAKLWMWDQCSGPPGIHLVYRIEVSKMGGALQMCQPRPRQAHCPIKTEEFYHKTGLMRIIHTADAVKKTEVVDEA